MHHVMSSLDWYGIFSELIKLCYVRYKQYSLSQIDLAHSLYVMNMIFNVFFSSNIFCFLNFQESYGKKLIHVSMA